MESSTWDDKGRLPGLPNVWQPKMRGQKLKKSYTKNEWVEMECDGCCHVMHVEFSLWEQTEPTVLVSSSPATAIKSKTSQEAQRQSLHTSQVAVSFTGTHLSTWVDRGTVRVLPNITTQVPWKVLQLANWLISRQAHKQQQLTIIIIKIVCLYSAHIHYLPQVLYKIIPKNTILL